MCARITPTLEAEQSEDQAGFRSGHSCEDHLLSIVLLIEAHREFNMPLWMSTVDFQKAFDSVEHAALWKALFDQGVDGHYIRLLRILYDDQIGKIKGPPLSKEFSIRRGTKQGDPMSPKLFNSVLEDIFRQIQPRWRERGWGIQIEGRLLCNLRFADDVVLIGASKKQVASMLGDLMATAAKAGLLVHSGKTKILSNSGDCHSGHVMVSGSKVDVLPFAASTDYLGRLLTLDALHDTELSNRLKKGWGKFFAFKAELCGKHISIKDRFRLFNAIVSPTVLYGSATWTMNTERTRQLKTTQRRMLRWMLGGVWKGFLNDPSGKSDDQDGSDNGTDSQSEHEVGSTPSCTEDDDGPEEQSWIEWLRCRTRLAEHVLETLKIEDWVQGQRRRKWTYAGHVMRREDRRWSTTLLTWMPDEGYRTRGRPKKRWTQVFDEFLKSEFGAESGTWMMLAAERDEWKALETAFTQFEASQ